MPVDPSAVPWSVRRGIGGMGLFVGAPILVGAIVGTIAAMAAATQQGGVETLLDRAQTDLGLGVVIVIGTIGTVLGAAAAWRLVTLRGATREQLLGASPTWPLVGRGVAIGVLGLIATTILTWLASFLIEMDAESQQQLLKDAADANAGVLLMIALLAVIAAPISEELVYRSIVYLPIRDRVGVGRAIWFSGGLFGLTHLELLLGGVQGVVGVGALVVLGALFAFERERTGSLVVPIVAHATFNGAAVALTVAA